MHKQFLIELKTINISDPDVTEVNLYCKFVYKSNLKPAIGKWFYWMAVDGARFFTDVNMTQWDDIITNCETKTEIKKQTFTNIWTKRTTSHRNNKTNKKKKIK